MVVCDGVRDNLLVVTSTTFIANANFSFENKDKATFLAKQFTVSCVSH